MSRRPHSDQLSTLTAHASQLQTRLLVALDTLDSQSLAHASDLSKLQESYDRLSARARRLEYERNTANEDLAEMTAVLELVIEKVSAANDYKVLSHSNIYLPSPLSPPRTTSSNRTSSRTSTPTDTSAYTSALVSALTAQLDSARAQGARERADAERKIARLEAMVELRDVEIKRNLGRSVNGAEQSGAGVSMEAIASTSGSPSGMSRGEAITAYEAVAKDNERLEKEVSRLRTEIATSDFNRATSEVGPSSSWAQIPDWARPQSQSRPQSQPLSQTQSQIQPPSRPQSQQTKSKRPIRSGSSDQAPSSASEHPTSNSNSSFELHVQGPRTRSSGSATADPNRSRTLRHSSVFSGSESDRGTGIVAVPRQEQTQPAGTSRRNKLRDSGLGADSGTDTTRLGTRPGSSSSGRVRTGTKGRERPTTESTSATPTQQQQETTGTSIQLMPLLPALTPSKVRAPRVEVIDLPNTSYIEPSFGIHLSRRHAGIGSDSSTLELPRSAALQPVPSPGLVSPIGELALPPSVMAEALGREQSTLAAPLSLDSFMLLPSSIGQSTAQSVRTMTLQTSFSPPPDSNATPIPTARPLLPQAPSLQPTPILQPTPSPFRPVQSLFPNAPQPQRSRSSSRTARLSPCPVFDLTGLPAYEAIPGATSTPATKPNADPSPSPMTSDELSSPTRRQSDPAPVSAPGSPPLLRQRSNSAIPASQLSRENSRVDSTFGGPPTTPPRSTNNTAQFAFITPVVDRTAEEPRPPTAGATSTGVEPGTTVPDQISIIPALNTTNNTTNNTTGRRRLLPLFKFISPSPGTPPSTKKRRANRAMTAPSQFGSSVGPGSPMGIASSPLARGRVVRESPLQLVMGAAHAGLREGMRIPVMREVGSGSAAAGAGMSSGMAGLVPPLVPTAPLVPLVAQLVPNAPPETQAALRGMQAERELLGRAQSVPAKEATAESMAKVLMIEAECIRLRRDSTEAAALRQEVMRLRAQLQQKERDQGTGVVEEQDYTSSTSTSQISDAVSESAETYSNADAESDVTVLTVTDVTLPEAHNEDSSAGLLRSTRSGLDTKQRGVAELKIALGSV